MPIDVALDCHPHAGLAPELLDRIEQGAPKSFGFSVRISTTLLSGLREMRAHAISLSDCLTLYQQQKPTPNQTAMQLAFRWRTLGMLSKRRPHALAALDTSRLEAPMITTDRPSLPLNPRMCCRDCIEGANPVALAISRLTQLRMPKCW